MTIIKISFSNIGYREMGLTKAIDLKLMEIRGKNDITLISESNSTKFKELIDKLQNKYQKNVVILIDEYDKPLIDYLDKANLHKAMENRDILKSFYSVLKDADPYLKLVFITGVSKFSKVSIFSDLNNITDLSLDLAYNEICGISQRELEDNFTEELKIYDKEKIRKWYNGYRFHTKGETVYNPYSLLSFFVKSTGTESAEVELLRCGQNLRRMTAGVRVTDTSSAPSDYFIDLAFARGAGAEVVEVAQVVIEDVEPGATRRQAVVSTRPPPAGFDCRVGDVDRLSA